MTKFEITRFGPSSIKAGGTFLTQATGENCLWIEVSSRVTKFAEVIFDGVSLRPDISEDGKTLTVRLHPAITMLPGECFISVRDTKLGFESQNVSLCILKSPRQRTEDVRRSVLEFWQRDLQLPEKFRGWGLASMHCVPWESDPRLSGVLQRINGIIKDGMSHGKENFLDKSFVDELRWRHALLFSLARLAIRAADRRRPCIVEAGVGDGKTGYALLSATRSLTTEFHAYLFDTWSTMNEEQLIDAETVLTGMYADLSLEITKSNLRDFEQNVTYVPGLLPATIASLNLDPEKDALVLVHIDLNVAGPTLGTLEHLFPMLVRGGIIIFDDYGWQNHRPTRDAINPYIASAEAEFVMLPTGQAFIIKN